MDQFNDFYKFVKLINKYGMQSGIVKVIPPKEWIDALPVIDDSKIQSIKIRNPIIQNINGAKGVYISENMERHRTYSLPEWKHLSQMQNHQPPVPRGQKRKSSVSYINSINTSKNHNIEDNDNNSSDKTTQRRKSLADITNNDKSQRRSQTSLESKQQALLENFDYNIDTSDYTPERCEFLENNYWKTLSYAHPMYGADCLGSIFDDSVTSWNVAKLPNLLDHLQEQIPGVNEAYLYAGLWKATFAWHLEDQDLHSINYLHFGAPKQWYSIPQQYAPRFYEVMKDCFLENFKECSEFLRHKTFIASPSYLQSKGVKVNSVVHNENEFIITFPYGYHAGFNYDYNLAESVNFALEEWLEIGLKAKKCECITDSVGIDVLGLINTIKEKNIPLPDLNLPETTEATSTEDEPLEVPQLPLIKKSTHKKRGRKRKSVSLSEEPALQAKPKSESPEKKIPKKRGRPRKVVPSVSANETSATEPMGQKTLSDGDSLTLLKS